MLTWSAQAQEEAVASLKAFEEKWVDSFEPSSNDREALEPSADDVGHEYGNGRYHRQWRNTVMVERRIDSHSLPARVPIDR
jgi:hypothetical protein